ncbi:uracil-DNA glycosylase family protein [Paracidovorax sp. MALMAid1276]|uniref:uracil-DNA glycosylase family protein n=1 Tax=Paracidovorax sp. MALMAid1276 TaxID=3411631 RepID=UPI003B9A2190
MSLHLDARQRAMLQEMGITVWGPPDTAAEAPAPAAAAAAPVAATAPRTLQPAVPPAAPSAAPSEAAAARTSAAAGQRAPAPAAPTVAGAPAPTHRLHAPQALYPGADPAQTPAGLGAGWLIVAETPHPADPLAGDAGRLLDNMLRAMQLHRHPRVYFAALERIVPGAMPTAAPGPAADAPADVAAALAGTVAQVQPALVLVLGHVAARAALGRAEPLGRLRAGPHQVAGRPAVVTYDPAFLLRSQDSKAAAWADLCHALALVRGAPPGAAVP